MNEISVITLIGWISAVAALITSVSVIIKYVSSKFDKLTEPIMKELKRQDYERCKTDLTKDIDDYKARGTLSDVRLERMFETYDHYVNDLHGNSWVHREIELIKEKESKKATRKKKVK